MTVDVVIPTFGQAEMTEACAKSLRRNTEPGALRIIWVDNGSPEPERQRIRLSWLCSGFDLLPVMLPSNLGFVKATNAGIALSTSPYVLLLNNDTELPPGWLPMLVECLTADPTVGMVGPRSSSQEQWQGRAPTGRGAVVLAANAMLAFFCVLIRREVIIQCGYLSEAYKIGLGDDDDYCERVKRAGWRLALRRDLCVTHHHRSTFKAVYGDGGWLEYQKENIELFKRKWNIP